MELKFERGDLLQLDPISHVGTMRLLPPGKKKKQKLLVGDDAGNLSCYEFKKGEPQTVFTMKLSDSPITSTSVGGTQMKRDKVFVASGHQIVGVTKKGKEFFKLTSAVTETINHIAVEDTKIWTGCEFIYSSYDNGNDLAFFMCHDHINCLLMEYVTNDIEYDALLGCQDNCIRVISGSQVSLQIATQAAVTAIASLYGDENKIHRSTSSIVFGNNKGSLSNVLISDKTITNGWTIYDDKKSAIKCIKIFDLTQDGHNEIIVGRDDGRIEVYIQDQSAGYPIKVFSKSVGETIVSVEAGKVNSTDYNEIIVAGYSGKILSFTLEPTQERAQEDTYGRSIQTVNNENRIKYLKKEVEALRSKVVKEREKVKTVQLKSNKAVDPFLSGPIDFPINGTFILNPEQAAYQISIEIQSPIDLVIVKSPTPLDLIDSDIGSAVVSITPQSNVNFHESHQPDYRFVATYRCQGGEKRLQVLIRTTEGEFGELVVTVVNNTPPKAAKVLKYHIKPLSLHTRLHDLHPNEESRPRSRIKYTGPANITVLHEWVLSIFPDVPSRIDENATGEKYYFKNTFTGAITVCIIKKYEVTFESENPSTIAIIRENFLRAATNRRIQMEESSSLNDQSIESFLTLIRGHLEYQVSLARKADIIDSIQEITLQEPDTRWLSTEYASMLQDGERIKKEFAVRAKNLDKLNGIITDMFVDWYKLKGVDARQGIPQLINVINTGNFADIVQVIKSFKR